jgi:hypothetical protein
MKFIKLTKKNEKEDIFYVNIEMISTITHNKITKIEMNNKYWTYVCETPKEIMELINNIK